MYKIIYKKVSEYLIDTENGSRFLNIYSNGHGKFISTLIPVKLTFLGSNSNDFFDTEEEALNAAINNKSELN